MAPFVQRSNFLCNCGRGHYKEDFCETISSLHQRLRRYCLKKLSRALRALILDGAGPFMEFGNQKKAFICEIILYLGQWYKRFRIKDIQ